MVTFVTVMGLWLQGNVTVKFKVNPEPLSTTKCVLLSGKCTPEMKHGKHNYRDNVGGQLDCWGMMQANVAIPPYCLNLS